MKVLIIEDEQPAANKLKNFINRYDSDIQILDVLVSVQDSINWFQNNEIFPDLFFMDIQLTDGLSFDILKTIEINKPIIFTTAYNQYAIEAFQLNSIAYLLKPFTYDHFFTSMKKIDSLKENLPKTNELIQLEQLRNLFSDMQPNYKNRFMVKVGEHIRSITTEQIALFYADGRIVYLLTNNNKRYIIDYKMEDLEQILNPQDFFRANRTYIIHINHIKESIIYSSSRLKIIPKLNFEQDIIISRDKVNLFKDWFGGMF